VDGNLVEPCMQDCMQDDQTCQRKGL